MGKINEKQVGDNIVLEFVADNNKTGNLQFTNDGFVVNGSVSSNSVINLEYKSDLVIPCDKGNMFECTYI